MTRPSSSSVDFWLGVGAVASSVALMAAVIPAWVPVFSPPRPMAMAPWVLPQASAALLGIAGAALAWRGGRNGTRPEATVWRGLLLGAAAVAGYVALTPWLGALSTGAVLIAAMVLARKGARAWPSALAAAAVATGLAWAMFVRLAATPLPRGPWAG